MCSSNCIQKYTSFTVKQNEIDQQALFVYEWNGRIYESVICCVDIKILKKCDIVEILAVVLYCVCEKMIAF